MSERPIVIVIAGPNGAGKTTFAGRLLTEEFAVDAFVNADEIAREMNDPDSTTTALAAGRIMLNHSTNSKQQGRALPLKQRSLLGPLRRALNA